MSPVKLDTFPSKSFNKKATCLKRILWYFTNALFVRASWNPFMKIKIFLLISFGAKIGKGLVIKNNVNIKFPWKLTLGNNVWLGENTWLDNLDEIKIGNNVCISQGALLLTGNHDYTRSTFDYRNAPITIEDGAWIGAKTVVCPGVKVQSHAILTVGSIATKDLEAYSIYQGNPAQEIRKRKLD